MSDKMQVLFTKQTGHVLAAFTRTADPEGKPKVSDLTGGNGLLVRNEDTTIFVAPETLDVSVVDLDAGVFFSPRDFVVGGGEVAKPGLNPVVLSSVTDDVPPLPPEDPPDPSPATIQFTSVRVTVVIEGDASDDEGVCVILQEANPPLGMEPERRVAQGAIAKATHYVSLNWKTSVDGALAPISNATQEFFILALVAGYQPLFAKRRPASIADA